MKRTCWPAVALTAGAFIAFLALPAAAQTRAKADVVVETRADLRAPALSPRLIGTQFNYFSTPIKARAESDVLLQTWRAASVRVLRYPGGTWGDHYIWDHPGNSFFDVPWANADTIITPAQFIAICRRTGVEPIFQVNLVSQGGSQENRLNPTRLEDIRRGARWAADWVRESNQKNGWKVKYWELGNEVWIFLHPDEYARMVVEYSAAMKAVDPTIKIIACGLSSRVGPFDSPWMTFPGDSMWKPRLGVRNNPETWNKALFTQAGGRFDLLAPHPYLDMPGEHPARDIYLQTVAQVWDQEQMAGQRAILRRYGSSVPLAVTEWGCNFSQSVSAKGGYFPRLYFYSLGNGLNTAHYLGQIIAGGGADMAVLHSLDEIQTLYFWPRKELAQKPLSHPAFLALQLWGRHLGARRLAQRVTGGPKLQVGGRPYPGVFTFASEDRDHLYLMAINLDPDAPHSFQWRPVGAALADRGTLSTVAGPALESDNWASWGKPAPLLRIETRAVRRTGSDLRFTLPAHSMAGLMIPKRRSR